jgi:carboxymethylenebutenolidase
MSTETFSSGGQSFEITIYPAPSDGKKYPVLVVVHGNWGLAPPYGQQILDFAASLSSKGYLTAVPKYYTDNEPHPDDTVTKEAILAAAIAHVSQKPGADPDRLGLVGYSLGAASAMTYIAEQPVGSVGVLVDFYGFLTSTIKSNLNKFPPTAIFHNERDKIVPYRINSEWLENNLPASVPHRLWPNSELNRPFHHAFKSGGGADVESRKEATDWLLLHLKPKGI